MQTTKKNPVGSLIVLLQEFTSIKIERDIFSKLSFSGTLGRYNIQKRLFVIYSFYQHQEYEAWCMQVFASASHCKDTHYFDKVNNFSKS